MRQISQAYAIKRGIELVESTNIKYDQIIIYRPDVMLWKVMDLAKYNPSKIYVNAHQQHPSGGDFHFPPIKFSLNNQTFLLLHKTQEKIVYFWVYMLGSPNEAKHFSYTLKLFGPKTTLTIEGKVAAIDECFDTLSKAGKCFTYPHKSFLDQLLNEENKFEYSLEIRKMKEES